jgi:organic hydroperoxide reductase OsmC/OhrA
MKKQEFTLKSMSADGKTLANKFVRRLKAHAYGEKRTEANEAMDRAYEVCPQSNCAKVTPFQNVV